MNHSSLYVGELTNTVYGHGELFDKECFNETIEVTFEKRSFLAPKQYDRILSSLYGDYMKLPPKEKRVTHPIVSVTFPDE